MLKNIIKLYKALDKGKKLQCQTSEGWSDVDCSEVIPCITINNFEHWRIKPQKIPLCYDILLESCRDCEFSYEPASESSFIGNQPKIEIGQLEDIYDEQGESSIANYLSKQSNNEFPYCRPRLNFWMAYHGTGCPIPDGLSCCIRLRSGDVIEDIDSHKVDWCWTKNPRDVMDFLILGVSENYCYPWEVNQ